jgi:hypothetical protein
MYLHPHDYIFVCIEPVHKVEVRQSFQRSHLVAKQEELAKEMINFTLQRILVREGF